MSDSNVATQETAATTEAVVGPIKNEAIDFHFKKDKLGEKRPTIKLTLPFLTLDGIIEALSDPKQAEFITSIVNEEIYKAARMQVGDDVKPVNSQEELDVNKLSINFLANMPKAERTGGGISKEIWEDFGKDYLEVMPAATGKNAEAIGNAVKLLLGKFQQVKTNKPVIKFLSEQLDLWATKSPNVEDFQECYEFLQEKAKTLQAADEAALLANL